MTAIDRAADKRGAQFPKPKSRFDVRAFFGKYSVFLVFVMLVIISSTISDVFFTYRNIFNILRQVAGLGIVAMGLHLVILTSGIDLAVGSVLALGSVLAAVFLREGSFTLSVILTITAGALMGAFSGALVSLRDMPPFVATLAVMTIARGLAYIISKGSPVQTENESLEAFGNGYFLGIPVPVLLMAGVVVLFWVLLRYTAFGRMVTAIGSNETAVRLAGIRVGLYKFSVYVISGGLAALAGIISTARVGVGSALVGVGLELDAIAAVVIGGTPLTGGRGSVWTTLLGVLSLGLIGNIMNLKDVPAYPQQVIKGIIIVLAVLFQVRPSKRSH